MKRNKRLLIIAAVLSAVCLLLTGCAAKAPSESEAVTSAAETSGSEETARDASGTTLIEMSGTSARITGNGAKSGNGNIIIVSAGTYTLSGELDGSVIIDAGDESVTLVLSGASVSSSGSSAVNAVKAGSVTLTAANGTVNTLTDTPEYIFDNDYSDSEKEEPDACVFAKCNLTVTGGGKLTVNGNYKNGIKSKDTLTVEGADITVKSENNALTGSDKVSISASALDLTAKGDGIHSNGEAEINSGEITVKSDDDAIHADSSVTVNGGTINIDAHEGIEGTLVTINEGNITVNASDDGINAAQKVDGVTPRAEINGGEITITMGAGDTDAIDSNGDIAITGGTINITAQSAFDYDGKAELLGGEVYVNGEKISEITNQFGGGMPGPGGGRGENFGNVPPDENGEFGRDRGNRGFAGENTDIPPEMPGTSAA